MYEDEKIIYETIEYAKFWQDRKKYSVEKLRKELENIRPVDPFYNEVMTELEDKISVELEIIEVYENILNHLYGKGN
jgi:hypothetical protein